MASKLGDETWLMTMKGGTVLNSVKMLVHACWGAVTLGCNGVREMFQDTHSVLKTASVNSIVR